MLLYMANYNYPDVWSFFSIDKVQQHHVAKSDEHTLLSQVMAFWIFYHFLAKVN